MNIVTTTRTVARARSLAVPPVGSYARREKTILRILRLRCGLPYSSYLYMPAKITCERLGG